MMQSECAEMFRTFRHLLDAFEVHVIARGSGPFLGCWKLFCAQPSPTPPHWWRFSAKTQPNQHVLDFLPPNSQGSQLWHHHHDQTDTDTDDEKKIYPMQTARVRFMNTRDYEIFVVGSLLRSLEAQEKLYENHWNGKYDYTMNPPQDLAFAVRSNKTYIITLELHARNFDYNKDAPPPPDVGTEVTVRDGDDEFSGVLHAVDDDNIVTMLVTRTKGTGAMLLDDRSGHFFFGKQSAPYVEAKKAINQALYFTPIPGFVPLIRTLALAQENQTIQALDPEPLVAGWRQHFPQLNFQQDLALRQSCELGDRRHLNFHINLIQGPPGTGKTHVVSQAVMDAVDKGHKILVAAETRFATNADAAAIQKAFDKANLSTEGVFLIQSTSMSGIDFEVEADPAPLGALWGAHLNSDDDTSGPQMSANSRVSVMHQLNKLLDTQPLSLAAYINKRIDLMGADDPSVSGKEILLLTDFQKKKAEAADKLMDPDEAESIFKSFHKSWQHVQAYYLTFHARVVVVTAATALHGILRRFHPTRMIIDEGSQMMEHTTIALIARHYSNLDKITIIGDLAQLGTFVPPQPSEFSVQTKLSSMGRLAASGVPITTLVTQYRMHPDISRMVSHLFYQDRLLDHESVLFREDDKKWTAFAQDAFGIPSAKHSLFVSTTPGPVYYTAKGRSLANPRHACLVGLILKKLIKAGAAANQIAILCGYKAQLRALRRLSTTLGVTLATIDSVRGREYPFVVLDLVTPGGSQYPLGFLTDTGRMCVALSRAMNGLVMIGNENMATGKHQNQGVKGWQTLIDHHKKQGALGKIDVPVNILTDMVKRLGLEGQQWKKYTPQ